MRRRPHTSHWGAFRAGLDGVDGALVVEPHPDDPEPSALLRNIPDAVAHPTRVTQPMVRRGWLEDGPGATSKRGREPFVAVSWDEALGLVAGELERVRDEHGPASVFAGSYGWASAGRFHRAQHQVHRFFALAGGFVGSRGSYSAGAAEVFLPRVLGPQSAIAADGITWDGVARETDLVVAFGGMPRRNQAVASGGVARHDLGASLVAARERGAAFVNVSPIRDDLHGSEWLPIRPASDVALMLALAYVLRAEGLADQAFLDRFTSGFDVFAAYLDGRSDGLPKTPAWAAELTGVAAQEIVALARRMAAGNTVISVGLAVQRSEHGEQPLWMGVVLAAMLGRFGPGAGFALALGGMANLGKPPLAVPLPSLPPLRNPVAAFIPVARVADMLLDPGGAFSYDGSELTYPDVRLVYWAGGNPFHHHQDLNRLRRAWGRPETVVVHEPFWTSTARHADIVLPATITLEREDLGAGGNEPLLVAMHRVVEPHAQARDDYAIFAALAERLGIGDEFTEGRDAHAWVVHLYGRLRERLSSVGVDAPPFDEFWERGEFPLPTREPGRWLRRFLDDPEGRPLPTASGRIEISSPSLARLGLDDCPGHPAWLPKAEWLGSERARDFPLQLVANQPATRLHSQLDFGAESRASKVAGREPMRIHPDDAAARGIGEGDIVRIFNDRGACLAGAVLSDALLPGVVQLATGAWYDPDDELGLCRHGNPNAVTRDAGTSRLAQATTGQLSLVQLERWEGPVPPVRVHEPPEIVPRDAPPGRPVA